jgi:hypothetical protein
MSKHGQLAPGMCRISLVLEEQIRDDLKVLAAASRHKFSPYVRNVLEDAVKLGKLRLASEMNAQSAAENHSTRRGKGK